MYHAPVLCKEAVTFLNIRSSLTYLDGTVGGGGHAEQICELLTGGGRLLCVDRDAEALAAAHKQLARFGSRTLFLHAPFDTLSGDIRALDIQCFAGILLDLGVSSHQLDEERRGFSFRTDAPLDMRMDPRQEQSAWHVVNTYDENRLADVLWRFGEERHSRRIARRIVERRPLNTTGDLRKVTSGAVGSAHRVKTLARVFQALRIEVNGELDRLARFLGEVPDLLQPGGRLVVISYHSLEDRIVKEFMRGEAIPPRQPGFLPVDEIPVRFRLVSRKPIVATEQEIAENPRARSAKMRVAERTDVRFETREAVAGQR